MHTHTLGPRSVDTSNNILYIIYISSVFTSCRLLIYLQQFRHHHHDHGRRFIFFSVEEYIIKYYSLYPVYCHYTLCTHTHIYRYLCTYYYKYLLLLIIIIMVHIILTWCPIRIIFYIIIYVICLANARRVQIETMPISFT